MQSPSHPSAFAKPTSYVTPLAAAICEPRQTSTSEPRQTRTGKPRQTRTGEPRQTRTGKPRQTRTGEPRQTRTGEPPQTGIGKPRQTRTGEPLHHVAPWTNRPWANRPWTNGATPVTPKRSFLPNFASCGTFFAMYEGCPCKSSAIWTKWKRPPQTQATTILGPGA
ncbi:MAG: hypothetical protein J7M25_02560 [Deltaproteobacteria bacterium]|nr:hypothetical protein [Deltaproteobacteria bacterium]